VAAIFPQFEPAVLNLFQNITKDEF